jgi:hypothetical protein
MPTAEVQHSVVVRSRQWRRTKVPPSIGLGQRWADPGRDPNLDCRATRLRRTDRERGPDSGGSSANAGQARAQYPIHRLRYPDVVVDSLESNAIGMAEDGNPQIASGGLAKRVAYRLLDDSVELHGVICTEALLELPAHCALDG